MKKIAETSNYPLGTCSEPAMSVLSRERDLYARALRELSGDIALLVKRVENLESRDVPGRRRAPLVQKNQS